MTLKVLLVSFFMAFSFAIKTSAGSCNLTGNLVGASLTGCNFKGATLDGLNLSGANLQGSNLLGASLKGTNLQGANLTQVNLNSAILSGAILNNANLAGANLNSANLTNTCASSADFSGANLVKSTTTGADFTNAKLTGANVNGVTLPLGGQACTNIKCNADYGVKAVSSCPSGVPICNLSSNRCTLTCDSNYASTTGSAACPTSASPICNTQTSLCTATCDSAYGTTGSGFYAPCSSSTAPLCSTASHTCTATCDASYGESGAAVCTSGSPICSPSTHTCAATCTGSYGSTGTASCPGALPVCNTATHTCGTTCNSNYGSSGTGSCPTSAPICNTLTSTCTATCDANYGVTTSNAPCSSASAPICNTSSHACTATCDSGYGIVTGHAACPTTEAAICNTATQTCTNTCNGSYGSSTTAVCAAGSPICNTISGTCTSTCASDFDVSGPAPCASSGQLCYQGSCVLAGSVAAGDSCDRNALCSATAAICDTVTHACTGTCDSDNGSSVGSAACPKATQLCNDGVCVDPGSVGAGFTCTASVQCNSAAPLCYAGVCVQCVSNTDCSSGAPICSAGTCVQCQSYTDCNDPASPVCDSLSSTCVACNGAYDNYIASDRCPNGGEICVLGQCLAASSVAAGGSCIQSSDCSADAPICNTSTSPGTCTTTCDSDWLDPAEVGIIHAYAACSQIGQVCDHQGLCIAAGSVGVGGACASASNCSAAAPICSAGVCTPGGSLVDGSSCSTKTECSSGACSPNAQGVNVCTPVCQVTDYECWTRNLVISLSSDGSAPLATSLFSAGNVTVDASNAAVPYITQQPSTLNLSADHSFIAYPVSWVDPTGYTPKLCLRLCPNLGVCNNSFICTPAIQDGLTSGTTTLYLSEAAISASGDPTVTLNTTSASAVGSSLLVNTITAVTSSVATTNPSSVGTTTLANGLQTISSADASALLQGAACTSSSGCASCNMDADCAWTSATPTCNNHACVSSASVMNGSTCSENAACSGAGSVLVSTGLNNPQGLAVDSSGNVYIADTANNAIKKWTKSTGAVSTLLSTGLNKPQAVAVDTSGNVYIADTSNNAIKKLVPGSTPKTLAQTGSSTMKVASPIDNALTSISAPTSIAVDSSGNVYFNGFITVGGVKIYFIAKFQTNASVITLATSTVSPLGGVVLSGSAAPYYTTTVSPSTYVYSPLTSGYLPLPYNLLSTQTVLASDAQNNLYIADTGNNAIRVWVSSLSSMITLVSTGLTRPSGIAVDTGGNVYVADSGTNRIVKLASVAGSGGACNSGTCITAKTITGGSSCTTSQACLSGSCVSSTGTVCTSVTTACANSICGCGTSADCGSTVPLCNNLTHQCTATCDSDYGTTTKQSPCLASFPACDLSTKACVATASVPSGHTASVSSDCRSGAFATGSTSVCSCTADFGLSAIAPCGTSSLPICNNGACVASASVASGGTCSTSTACSSQLCNSGNAYLYVANGTNGTVINKIAFTSGGMTTTYDPVRIASASSLLVPSGQYSDVSAGIQRTGSTSNTDRPIVRTQLGSFYTQTNWSYSVTVTPAASDDLIYIGFGEGLNNASYYNEPVNAFQFRINSFASLRRIDIAVENNTPSVFLDLTAGVYNSSIVGIPTTFTITRNGDAITLAVPSLNVSKTYSLAQYAPSLGLNSGMCVVPAGGTATTASACAAGLFTTATGSTTCGCNADQTNLTATAPCGSGSPICDLTSHVCVGTATGVATGNMASSTSNCASGYSNYVSSGAVTCVAAASVAAGGSCSASGACASGSSCTSHVCFALTDLDLTKASTQALIKQYQAAGLLGGTLTVTNGVATGSVLFSDASMTYDLMALNIPVNTSVTLENIVSLTLNVWWNDAKIDGTLELTSDYPTLNVRETLIMNGTLKYDVVDGAVNIGKSLIMGSGAKLKSDKNLDVVVFDDVTMGGQQYDNGTGGPAGIEAAGSLSISANTMNSSGTISSGTYTTIAISDTLSLSKTASVTPLTELAITAAKADIAGTLSGKTVSITTTGTGSNGGFTNAGTITADTEIDITSVEDVDITGTGKMFTDDIGNISITSTAGNITIASTAFIATSDGSTSMTGLAVVDNGTVSATGGTTSITATGTGTNGGVTIAGTTTSTAGTTVTSASDITISSTVSTIGTGNTLVSAPAGTVTVAATGSVTAADGSATVTSKDVTVAGTVRCSGGGGGGSGTASGCKVTVQGTDSVAVNSTAVIKSDGGGSVVVAVGAAPTDVSSGGVYVSSTVTVATGATIATTATTACTSSSSCSDPTPICGSNGACTNVLNSQGGNCTQNSDCASAAPVCDTTSHTCQTAIVASANVATAQIVNNWPSSSTELFNNVDTIFSYLVNDIGWTPDDTQQGKIGAALSAIATDLNNMVADGSISSVLSGKTCPANLQKDVSDLINAAFPVPVWHPLSADHMILTLPSDISNLKSSSPCSDQTLLQRIAGLSGVSIPMGEDGAEGNKANAFIRNILFCSTTGGL